MLTLDQCLDKVYPFSPPTKELMKSCFKLSEFPAKTVLIKEGEISKKLYFIAKGCLRSYYEQKVKEVTLWFGNEGDFFTCFRSMINNEPGHENIFLSEDCAFYEISSDTFKKLAKENQEVNNFYTKVMEESYLYWENRVMMLLFFTAKERYANLMQKSPFVLQRFSLSQIASYLGITQETLSRIRAEK